MINNYLNINIFIATHINSMKLHSEILIIAQTLLLYINIILLTAERDAVIYNITFFNIAFITFNIYRQLISSLWFDITNNVQFCNVLVNNPPHYTHPHLHQIQPMYTNVIGFI